MSTPSRATVTTLAYSVEENRSAVQRGFAREVCLCILAADAERGAFSP
jgi:hypothetical protein